MRSCGSLSLLLPLVGHRWLTGVEGKAAVAVDLWGEDVSPWITTLSLQVPVFACSHTQHSGHQKSKACSDLQRILNRHGLKWLETK